MVVGELVSPFLYLVMGNRKTAMPNGVGGRCILVEGHVLGVSEEVDEGPGTPGLGSNYWLINDEQT